MSVSQSWLEFEKSIGRRPLLKGTAQEVRDKFAELGGNLIPLYSAPSDTVTVEPGSFRGIAYRIYTPHNASQPATKKLPIGVYFHPGGFVVGSLDAEELFCRSIAENAQVILVSVDYRLAPEHKAPAQLEDAVSIAESVYHDKKFESADRTRFFTIGTSAGGALALEVARKVVLDQTSIPKDAVKGVVAFCPVTFHPTNNPIPFEENNTPIIDREALIQYSELCGIQPDNADYFVGLDPESHSLFPPTYVITCGFDPLREDGRLLAESLESRGVPVKRDHYESLPHVFWMVPTLPESKTFAENTFQGVKWVLSKMN